jgi:hypothetical protein
VPAGLTGPAAVAGGLAAACLLAVLAGLVLVTRADAWGTRVAESLPVDAAVAVAYPLSGAVVLLSGRARVLGWLLVLVGSASAAAVLASSVVAAASSAGPVVVAAAWLQGWVWVPGFAPLLAVLPLLYPDGRLPSPRWRLPLAAGLVGTGLVTLAVALHPEDVVGGVVVAKPLTAEAVARVVVVPGAGLLVLALLSGLAALAVRLRRSSGLERRQVLVAAVAAGLLVAELLVHGWLPPAARAVAQPLAVALLPVALGVAVTRHDLFQLDVAVLRALTGLSTALCLAGAFVTLFALVRALLPDETAVATAAAAGLTGLAVQPVARRLAAATDRLYYGDRTDPWRALDVLAVRLGARWPPTRCRPRCARR